MTPSSLTPKPALGSGVDGIVVSMAAFQGQPLEPSVILLYWAEASGSRGSRRPSKSEHINLMAQEENSFHPRLLKQNKALKEMIWAKWEIHHSPHCFSYFETFVVLSISFSNACQSHYGWIWLCYAMSSVTRQNFELTGYISSETCSLDQGLANIFYKGPDSKYFRLCRAHMLFSIYSTFLVWHKSSRRWYDNTDDMIT